MYMDKIATRIKAKAKKDAYNLRMFSCLGRAERAAHDVGHLAWRDIHKTSTSRDYLTD